MVASRRHSQISCSDLPFFCDSKKSLRLFYTQFSLSIEHFSVHSCSNHRVGHSSKICFRHDMHRCMHPRYKFTEYTIIQGPFFAPSIVIRYTGTGAGGCASQLVVGDILPEIPKCALLFGLPISSWAHWFVPSLLPD